VHSLHAYFLRPGDPGVPILYEVDRIRDGRSFSTRRVVAIQHGRAIFNLQASFHDLEPGPDHQLTMPEDVGDPEQLPDVRTRMAPYADLACLGAAFLLLETRVVTWSALLFGTTWIVSSFSWSGFTTSFRNPFRSALNGPITSSPAGQTERQYAAL
jgi:hypothetical protein